MAKRQKESQADWERKKIEEINGIFGCWFASSNIPLCRSLCVCVYWLQLEQEQQQWKGVFVSHFVRCNKLYTLPIYPKCDKSKARNTDENSFEWVNKPLFHFMILLAVGFDSVSLFSSLFLFPFIVALCISNPNCFSTEPIHLIWKGICFFCVYGFFFLFIFQLLFVARSFSTGFFFIRGQDFSTLSILNAQWKSITIDKRSYSVR